MATVSLLSIGDELLLGEIVDTNKPYIAQQLLPLGLTVVGAETVGDEIGDIVAAFQRALSRADIVIATGGLGPTDDDLTNEALAKTLGVELEFRDDVMEQMAARLKRSVASLPGSNRKQALLPKGALVLRNDWGTAPGVHVPVEVRDGKFHVASPVSNATRHVFLMAGVPREMKGILAERIIPFLKQSYRSGRVLAIKKLHAFGIPESVVGDRIKPMMQAGHNPNVGTRVGGGVVTVRLVASGSTDAEAQAILQPCVERAREALREGLFGEDDQTLAEATLSALLKRKSTVAIAESCTAGLISAMLTEVPGSSAALLEGTVVYSNEAKVRTCAVKPETLAAHGAVSAQTAAELASGIRERARADFGLSVTGIAGPGGGTETKPVGLVYFGIATAAGVRTVERNYPGLDRGMVRDRAATQALDLLRRAALE
ncbi:MAG TPA: competence/damage-inducible protein A [Planctomycetota bacterium]|nr:competence/damage-inducible protein A [Planctomycetota bacterium]